MSTLYTYRCGQKIEIEKNSNQMVVRGLPDELKKLGYEKMEQVSSASTKVTISPEVLEREMVNSRGLAVTHHAYVTKEDGDEFLISDRVFVRFKKDGKPEELNEFIAKYGLVLVSKYSAKEFLFQLTNYTNMNPVKLVVQLTEEDDLVDSAGHDLNRRFKKYMPPVPTDTSYLNQWHLHDRLNHSQFDRRSSSNCEMAWDLLGNFGDPNVVVAVTDDGCRLDHEDFNSVDKFASWGYFTGSRLVNSTDFDAQSNLMYLQGSNHGTSCCGVIAGEVDAVKTVGASPDCQLLPIRWESSGPSLFISDSKLITALDYISDKADVMSNSWGSSPNSTWENEVLNKIRQLSASGGRRGKGIVFLWAAGNENCPIEHTSNQNIPYSHGWNIIQGSWAWVGVNTSRTFRHNLADLDGVMHIAALASTAKRSHYSNYGDAISLCAPSSNSHSYGRLMVEGLGITTSTGNNGGVTDSFGGTSSATPLVAGVAALVISANPDLSATEVISLLKTTASKDLNFDGYARTPPASYNQDTSWDISPVSPFENGSFIDNGLAEGSWSPWFGHGKVDAVQAVSEALSQNSNTENVFKENSIVNQAIPDNSQIGITNSIPCTQAGFLKSIKVAVEIEHTFIGDLQVTLVSPLGKEVLLHDRNGGSQNNLKKVFDQNNTAFLNTLIRERILGDWRLKVKDLASIDLGSLVQWSIELGMEQSNDVVLEESPGIAIPDNSSVGIQRSLSTQESGNIRQLEIDLDITHTFIGDLTVQLISPQNEHYILQDRQGGSADNILRTYSSANTPELSNLIGESIQGDWKLRVHDQANIDVGKLNRWKIKFTLD